MAFGVGVMMRYSAQKETFSYTPAQLLSAKIPKQKLICLAGVIKQYSIEYCRDTSFLRFLLIDEMAMVQVVYLGVAFSFEPGDQVTVQGFFDTASQVFNAHQITDSVEISTS